MSEQTEPMVDGRPVTEEELRFVQQWSGGYSDAYVHDILSKPTGAANWLWALRLHRTLAGLRADVDCLLSADSATAKVISDPETGLLAKVAKLVDGQSALAFAQDEQGQRVATQEKHVAALEHTRDANDLTLHEHVERIMALEAKSHSHDLPLKAEWYEQMVAEHGMRPDDAAVEALQRGCDEGNPEPPADDVPVPTQAQMALILANLDYQAEFLFVDGPEDEDAKEACRVGAAYLRAGCPRPDLEQRIAELETKLADAEHRADGLQERLDETEHERDRLLEAPQATIDLNAWLREKSATSPAHIQNAMIDVANYLSVSGEWSITVPCAPGTLDEAFAEAEREGWKLSVSKGWVTGNNVHWEASVWQENRHIERWVCGPVRPGATPQAAARAALDAAKEASGRG